ncbi:hypothetical protein ACWEDF_04380 [Micromonospora chersina]
MDSTQWMEVAQAGATALVAAMATDAWTTVRSTAARLVGANTDERSAPELTWLEERRHVLAALPADDRAVAVAALREQVAGVLLARLIDHPERAELVERIIAATGSATPVTAVTQHATADRGGRVFQAGRDGTFLGREP